MYLDSQADSIDKNSNNYEAVSSDKSTINEINPIKPVILDLPNETIYKGIVKRREREGILILIL